MDPSVLEQLREETRLAHLALETQPLLKRLLSPEQTRAEYGQLLQAMLAFYQSLEAELVPATECLLGRYPDTHYRYRPRAPLLADDCRVLDSRLADQGHSPIPLPLRSSDAYLLGVLYVIEGSTQGGRLISRHLATTLGIRSDSGASFFNLHQQEDSWLAFRRWSGGDLAYNCKENINRVIEGADMTFTALHCHLDQWKPLVHGK